MSAGVLAERRGHEQRAVTSASGRRVIVKGQNFSLLVAHAAPVLAEIVDASGLKVLREQHARIALKAFVPRILHRRAGPFQQSFKRRASTCAANLPLLAATVSICNCPVYRILELLAVEGRSGFELEDQ